MARALSIHRAIITAGERTAYLSRLKSRQQHYARAGCKFWVFEEVALPGAFVEFTEASDAAALTAAHASSPEPVLDPARIYAEVELT